MACLGNSEKLVWGKSLLQTVQDGWKDMLRSHYGREDGMDLEDMRKKWSEKWNEKWKRLSKSEWDQGRDFLEQKLWLSKTERINEGWEEIMKNEILGKGILTFLVLLLQIFMKKNLNHLLEKVNWKEHIFRKKNLWTKFLASLHTL